MHRRSILSACSSAFMTLGAAMASAAETTSPIIVTATRTAQDIATSLAAVTVINREEIEQSQARDLTDILRRHAGIDVVRAGPAGQQTSIFMRGGKSQHTLILLDGVKLNPGSSGIPSVQFIDPSLIERIEIVRGPRSTLYGSDAVGGVINIITREVDADRSASFSATVGAHNTRQVSAHAAGRQSDWQASLDVQTQDSQGFPTRTTSAVDRGYNNASYNLKLGTRFGATDVELRRWQSVGTSDYVDFALTPIDQDFNNHTTALQFGQGVNARWHTQLTLSRTQDQLTQNQSDDYADSVRDSLDWQNDIELGAHLITAGITLWREQTSVLSFGGFYDEDTDIDEVFAQDDIRIGAHNFLIGARHTDHESFGQHTTWNLGYGFSLTPRTHLYASAGTAFQAPTATDRFGFGGNPDLRPEESRTYELGVRQAFSATTHGRLALFDTDIDDLIEFDSVTFQMQNIHAARIRGIELGLDHRRGRWETGIEAIWQDPRNATEDEWLARRARRSLTGYLAYHTGATRLAAELVAQNQRKDSRYSNVVNPGYAVVNLLAETGLAKDVSLGARVENLFDRDYRIIDGFRTEDRSLYITLRYRPSP